MSGTWNNLTMREKAGFIKIGVDNGLTSLSDIQNAYNKFALGGHIYDGETEDSQQIETTKPSIAQRIKLGLANLDNEVFGRVLLAGQALLDTNPNKRKDAKYGLTHSKEDLGKGNDIYYLNGLPQSTFLLPEWERQILFENAGWHRLSDGSYNLVNKAASRHGKALPTYQSRPDAIDRNKLFPFGNMITPYSIVNGDYELPDANDRPSTFYINPEDNKIYVKEEDLNDYSNIGLLGRMLDKVGNPLVVTTGIQPYLYGGKHIDMQDLFNAEAPGARELDRYMQNQGLRRERINGKWQFVTPDVVITPNGYAWGGNLYGDGGDENGGVWGAIKDIGKRVYHNVRDVLMGGMNRGNENTIENPIENTISVYEAFSPEYRNAIIDHYNEDLLNTPYDGRDEKDLITDYNTRMHNNSADFQHVYNAFARLGLSDDVIAAYLGNIMWESKTGKLDALSADGLFTSLFQYDTDGWDRYKKWLGSKPNTVENLVEYEVRHNKLSTPYTNALNTLGKDTLESYIDDYNNSGNTHGFRMAIEDPYYRKVTKEEADEVIKNGPIPMKTLAVLQRHIRAGKPKLQERILFANKMREDIDRLNWREQYNKGKKK